jgi:hypothetical protein
MYGCSEGRANEKSPRNAGFENNAARLRLKRVIPVRDSDQKNFVMPAQAGIHAGRDAARCSWTTAFAGVTEFFRFLSRVGIRPA